MSMTDTMVDMDIASATKDAIQTIRPIATPTTMLPSGSFWDSLIAQIQALFARLGMLLNDLEARADMSLSQIENLALSNPSLTPAARQRIMNRIDASQMRVDSRFDQARMNLMTADTRTIGGLERARMVDLGGGDMVPATMVTRDIFGRMITVHGRHGIPRHIPPGLAKKIPPGIPPGQARRFLDMSGSPTVPNPNLLNLRFNK